MQNHHKSQSKFLVTLTFPISGTACVVIPIQTFACKWSCRVCTVGINITVMRSSNTFVDFWKVSETCRYCSPACYWFRASNICSKKKKTEKKIFRIRMRNWRVISWQSTVVTFSSEVVPFQFQCKPISIVSDRYAADYHPLCSLIGGWWIVRFSNTLGLKP